MSQGKPLVLPLLWTASLLLAFLAVGSHINHVEATDVAVCHDKDLINNITDNIANLSVDQALLKTSVTCIWKLLQPSTFVLYLKNVHLNKDDTVVVKSNTDPKFEIVYQPDSLTGVIVAAKNDWSIELHLGPNNEHQRSFDVGFRRDPLKLLLDVADVNPLIINPAIGGQNINLSIGVRRSSPSTTTLIQYQGSDSVKASSKAFELSTGFILADSTTDELDMTISVNTGSTLMASDVLVDCSAGHSDDIPKEYPFVLPKYEQKLPYACVQLLKFDNKEAYFQIDFSGFKTVNDQGDTIKFTDSDAPLVINKRVAGAYEGKVLTFKGNELAMLYESPVYIRPLKISAELFKMSGRSFGGYQGSGILKKPTNLVKEKFIRYIYNGQPYSSIALGAPLPSKVSMHVYADYPVGEPLVSFKEGEALPPVISLDYEKELIVQFNDSSDGSAFKKLPPYEFKQQKEPCHKMSHEHFDYMSINGMTQSDCTWFISTRGQDQEGSIVLSVEYLDFNDDKDCFEVRKLSNSGDEIIASLCGNYKYKSPTRLLLDKNFKHYVKVSRGSASSNALPLSFYASYSFVVPRDASSLKVPIESNNMTLTSIGYPAPYPVGFSKKYYVLDAITNSTYNQFLVVFRDVNIRDGDQLALTYAADRAVFLGNDNYTSIGDTLTNGSVGITLHTNSPKVQLDEMIGQHKGFEVNVLAFDYAVRLTSGNSTITPDRAKNAAIIVTSRDSASSENFARRIVYNTTTTGKISKNTETIFYDGRTIGNQRHLLKDNNGVTTSDTLIMLYKFKDDFKPNNDSLPALTLSYKWKDCDTKNGEHICDSMSRCIPKSLQCDEKFDCDDLSDENPRICNGTSSHPEIKEIGVGGVIVFMLCVFMFVAGVVLTMYGPDMYRFAETRFRSGDYTTFTSSE